MLQRVLLIALALVSISCFRRLILQIDERELRRRVLVSMLSVLLDSMFRLQKNRLVFFLLVFVVVVILFVLRIISLIILLVVVLLILTILNNL